MLPASAAAAATADSVANNVVVAVLVVVAALRLRLMARAIVFVVAVVCGVHADVSAVSRLPATVQLSCFALPFCSCLACRS